MTVAAYRDRTSGRYPVSLDEVRSLAGVLFGDEPDIAALDGANVDPVEASSPPTFDPATQQVVEGVPVKLNGVWCQTWKIEALPPTAPVFEDLSDRQFFQALASPPYNIITEQESLDAVRTGEIPAVMQAVIDALPDDHQYPVTMLIAGATVFKRTNPFVPVFGASQGMDEKAINAFWLFAEKL